MRQVEITMGHGLNLKLHLIIIRDKLSEQGRKREYE